MAQYHKSIRTLPIWNFTQRLLTKDNRFLFVDIPEKADENIELDRIWNEIYHEFCVASKIDNKNLKQIYKVEELKLKYTKISNLLDLAIDEFYEVRQAARTALKGYNYIFREGQRFPDEYKRLKRQLNSLSTKIEIEKSKLPKDEKKQGVNLIKEAVALENMFTGREIDIYTIPVEKWLTLWDLAKEKIKARKQTA